MAYGQLASEANLETIPHDKAPYSEWPDNGVIELHNTRFKYAIDYPYALKSISFKIQSCEKVDIVWTVMLTGYIHAMLHVRLVLWVGLELASLHYWQHCSD